MIVDQYVNDAYNITKELDNQLLMVYAFKPAFFFGNILIGEQNQMLQRANQVFMQNNMTDNAIYCKNNMLIRQFYFGNI